MMNILGDWYFSRGWFFFFWYSGHGIKLGRVKRRVTRANNFQFIQILKQKCHQKLLGPVI